MGKRGPKPRRKEINWSANLAYAIGLLTADGCLLNDGRHIDLTSKDVEQLKNFKQCLGLKVKIGYKTSGYNDGKKYRRVQFGDVVLYNFLLKVGLTPNKSKTTGALNMPDEYFFDFLRGVFDGDGSTYSYFDPRWRSSFMYYLNFTSASPKFLDWLQKTLKRLLSVSGTIVDSARCQNLRFAKVESSKIIKKMYYNPTVICLSRKRRKIQKTLKIDKDLTKSRASGGTADTLP